MRIYIDEAGNFVSRASGQPLYSLVLGLVVPSSLEAALFAEFSSLLSSWPGSGTEIKGSKLDETEAAQLIDLVSRHDVFAHFFAVDMARHGETLVSDFKERQAAAITAGLTPEHHVPIVAQLEGIAAAIRRMPNQLFVQAFLMIELVLKVIEESTLYYVQRIPSELGSIAWTIDRKDRTITEMENTWSTLVLPMSENHFARKPLLSLKEADYSYFDARYRVKADDAEASRHVQWMQQVYGILEGERPPGLDATLLLGEQREFADSAGSLGLQLADMLAAILRRALNNRLQPPGWARYGRLLIANNSATPFLQLGPPDGRGQQLRGQHIEEVYRALKSGNKQMLVRRSLRS
ncbi:MAG TPA: DUF3800 domain-containing protein [Candidatus Acidoferrales bacterium]|nr:DUF3800 domain-containing protein [Candidatus Acidoferrales bacterium]